MSIPAPVEPTKTAFLHDRTTRPVAPATSRAELAKHWGGFIAGLVLSVGLSAVLFSVRDSWENHREWLVTVIPALVIAGVALGHLLARKQLRPLLPGLAFLFFALLFAGFDVIADNDNGATMTVRDTLSILGGICLGIAVFALTVAFFWVELRNPTKAPAPEL